MLNPPTEKKRYFAVPRSEMTVIEMNSYFDPLLEMALRTPNSIGTKVLIELVTGEASELTYPSSGRQRGGFMYFDWEVPATRYEVGSLRNERKTRVGWVEAFEQSSKLSKQARLMLQRFRRSHLSMSGSELKRQLDAVDVPRLANFLGYEKKELLRLSRLDQVPAHDAYHLSYGLQQLTPR